MDLFRQNLRLNLVRPNLDGVPETPLPPGYSFRWFRRGDAAHWLLIQHDADPFNDITPDLFTRQFGVDLSRLEDRQIFVQDDIGRVVGTATAWPESGRNDATCGRVFWLAVLRQFQGRGLGKSLLGAACRRLQAQGYQRACVVTSTGRLPAVSLYLQYGFKPEIRSDAEHLIWEKVFATLQAHGHLKKAAAVA